MAETKKLSAREIIQGYKGPKLRIMEVCGTHTHEIFRLGIRNILPENIELISIIPFIIIPLILLTFILLF